MSDIKIIENGRRISLSQSLEGTKVLKKKIEEEEDITKETTPIKIARI